MKIITSVNPDYADFDEIDPDVVEAIEDFYEGRITPEELKILIGPEAAQSLMDLHEEDPVEILFDDPEEF